MGLRFSSPAFLDAAVLIAGVMSTRFVSLRVAKGVSHVSRVVRAAMKSQETFNFTRFVVVEDSPFAGRRPLPRKYELERRVCFAGL